MSEVIDELYKTWAIASFVHNKPFFESKEYLKNYVCDCFIIKNEDIVDWNRAYVIYAHYWMLESAKYALSKTTDKIRIPPPNKPKEESQK